MQLCANISDIFVRQTCHVSMAKEKYFDCLNTRIALIKQKIKNIFWTSQSHDDWSDWQCLLYEIFRLWAEYWIEAISPSRISSDHPRPRVSYKTSINGLSAYGAHFCKLRWGKKSCKWGPLRLRPRGYICRIEKCSSFSDFEQDDEDVGYQVTNSSAQFIQSVSSDQLILGAPPLYHDLVHSADRVRCVVS